MARVITQDDLTPVAMLPQGGGRWDMVIPLGVVVTPSTGEIAPAMGRVWTLEACPQ